MTILRWLLCRLSWPFDMFSHRFELIEEYDQYTRKLKCRDCERYFAMSDRYEAVLPWDDDYESIICDTYQLPRTKR